MYLADWSESKLDGLKSDFDIDDVVGEILFAAYTYEDYSGDAFVIFTNEGKLFEVNGGHCSCYGLEGQWEPEETTKGAIIKRLENRPYGILNDYSKEIRAALSKIHA